MGPAFKEGGALVKPLNNKHSETYSYLPNAQMLDFENVYLPHQYITLRPAVKVFIMRGKFPLTSIIFHIKTPTNL